MIPFPEKKYSVIYADPPWNYAAGGKTRNVERHYRTMKPEDIYCLDSTLFQGRETGIYAYSFDRTCPFVARR